MARAIWKGNISFGLVNIPVQLFSAEKPSEHINLHLLDKKTHSRIHNVRVNEMGNEVPWEQIEHAYEFNKGKYVIVDPKTLEKTAQLHYESIEIDSFVPLTQIEPIFFAKPYFLLPDSAGLKGYTLLRDILKDSKKVGIATVVIKTREHIAAIMPHNDILMLIILRYAKEMHKAADFLNGHAKNVKVTTKEIALATQLVNSMSGNWKPEKYVDKNTELLRKLINTAIKKGKTISHKKRSVTTEKIIDFATLLEQSVSKKSHKKPHQKKK